MKSDFSMAAILTEKASKCSERKQEEEDVEVGVPQTG